MRPFEIDARAAWNAGAEAYSQFVESGADYYRLLVHGPGLLEACGDVRDQRALDLGCGQGYFSRLLAGAGATVTGVDLSDELIARAVALENADPLGITYLQADATRADDHFPPESFDLVTGCMSLQDMADPARALGAARRLLKRDGRAVFSVPHPCTDPPVREWLRDENGAKKSLCLDRYFDSGPAVMHWNMKRLTSFWHSPCHRFTLSEWGRMIHDAGFLIRGFSEPRPSADLLARHPELEDCSRMPYFLIFDLVGTASPTG